MNILIPQEAMPIMADIEAEGGTPVLVGGIVRDQVIAQVRGLEVAPSKDVDIEVHGLSLDRLIPVLQRHGLVHLVGASFGVIKVTLSDGQQIDVSLPRRESKDGRGHKGFMVEPDPFMTIEEAASRRDFTINSMLARRDGTVEDPFDGFRDIVGGMLRATSERFADDPLRVLRGMQFAARFNLVMDVNTAMLSRSLLPEFGTLSAERIFGEFSKLARAPHPSAGLEVLVKTGWIAAFPILAALRDVPQDAEWQPEGDGFEHPRQTADRAAEIARREGLDAQKAEILVFAGMFHDVGKATTTEHRPDGRIISHGHADAGADMTADFLASLRAPEHVLRPVVQLVREHMVHTGAQPTPAVVRRLARRLAPGGRPELHTTVRMLTLLSEADASGRAPAPAANPMAEWAAVAEQLNIAEQRPEPILKGRHLIAAGFTPGPIFRTLLQTAFELQLEGEITDEASAIAWMNHAAALTLV